MGDGILYLVFLESFWSWKMLHWLCHQSRKHLALELWKETNTREQNHLMFCGISHYIQEAAMHITLTEPKPTALEHINPDWTSVEQINSEWTSVYCLRTHQTRLNQCIIALEHINPERTSVYCLRHIKPEWTGVYCLRTYQPRMNQCILP